MDNNLLTVAFVFLLAAAIAVPLAQRLGMGSVLGYLLAGIVIGPWGLSLISDVDAILHFAEFGVVLLLFLIGLELNPKKLLQMRRPIIVLGGSQVLATAVVIGAISVLVGLTLRQGVVIGVGLALSSTAIAMKIIEDQRLMRSETGQSGFAVLLFQDIAVIPMLAVIPALAGGSAGSWLDVLWMFVGIGVLLVGGHFLLRPLFRLVAVSGVTEIFTVTSLALVICIA